MKQETIFLSVAANHFSEMRLMAEGAIALYENQATVLCCMARDADNHEDHFYEEMYDQYCYYYREQIDLHPEKPMTSPFENS